MPGGKKKNVSLAKKFEENFESDDEEEVEEEYVPLGRRISTMCTHIAYMFKTFAQLNGKDIRRRKGSYCLGVMSCLLVVLITGLMLTILSNLPILFLRLGEAESGETDLVLSTGGEAILAPTLNYTKIAGFFKTGERSYHTARTVWGNGESWPQRRCGTAATEAGTNTTFLWLPPSGKGFSDAEDCTVYGGCPASHCGQGSGALTVFYDPDAEERMGLGTTWTAKKPTGNEAVISQSFASEMGLAVGDTFYHHKEDMASILLHAYKEAGLERFAPFSTVPNGKYVAQPAAVFALTVIDIIDGAERKLSSSIGNFFFVNINAMSQIVSTGLSPDVTEDQRAAFAAVDPMEMAGEVIFNMPPATRIPTYSRSDYADVQNGAIAFASPIIANVGFNQIEVSMPIVTYMFDSRFFSLFLGLILSMIIAGLSALSVILIYSLLIVGVETKTFELAVMRMVGMTRVNLVCYVLTSASAFAIPAWVLGLTFAQLLFLAVRSTMNSALSVELPVGLSGDAIGYATLAGLGIPLVSSFAPMSSVISQDLPSALDTNRSRVETIKYEISKQSEFHVEWLLVGFGTALVVFGFLIYYLFPLALLTFDITLLFYIFFGLLLGMLFGFVLLAINLERVMETIITYLFLWWESDANFLMVEKNMTAHRRRNRKTTLMFSMALGFIIFITVAFQIQLSSVEYATRRAIGGELNIEGESRGKTFSFYQMVEIDKILNTPDITALRGAYTWRTGSITDQNSVANSSMMTIGRLVTASTRIQGLAPNFYDVVDDQFLNVRLQNENSGYSLSEQLYTVEGSGKAIVGSAFRESMALDNLNERFNVEVRTENVNSSGTFRRVASPLALVDISPVVRFSAFPNFGTQTLPMSVPSYMRRSFSLNSVRDVGFFTFIIRCEEENADTLQARLTEAMAANPAIGPGAGIDVINYFKEVDNLSTARTVVNVFFVFTQVMAMVICFFSLMSSMAANIHEQAKEIGVLRAIGMHKFPLKRLYVEEAFIIVVSSSVMGVVVGVGVAYTMMLQRSLFTQLPLPFLFPWLQLVFVVSVALVGAILSSYGPITALLSAPSIPHILRRTT